MHIVVFPGWYPNRIDKLSGDFIQRHLRAIALHCRVTAVIPVKDKSISKVETQVVQTGNLTEIYCYYPSLTHVKWLDNVLSFIRYNYVCVMQAKVLHKQNKISLVQLYVLQKNHLLGVMLKLLLHVPYVVSEQSTLYVDGGFDKMNSARQWLWKYAFRKAASFHAVSAMLAKQIKSKLRLQNDAVVIPNVVDSSVFYYKPHETYYPMRFAHVSNMVFQKNVEGMLQAFAKVKKANVPFLLNLVGPLPASIATLIKSLDLQQEVFIRNERSNKEVAEILQQSDAFVFFTRFETFGCVTIEANACGLPVILTNLEVSRELVTENVNGLFVESENVEALTQKILWLSEHRNQFDSAAIAQRTISIFNYENVGRKFMEWFKGVC